jgi:hypothetical protein
MRQPSWEWPDDGRAIGNESDQPGRLQLTARSILYGPGHDPAAPVGSRTVAAAMCVRPADPSPLPGRFLHVLHQGEDDRAIS